MSKILILSFIMVLCFSLTFSSNNVGSQENGNGDDVYNIGYTSTTQNKFSVSPLQVGVFMPHQTQATQTIRVRTKNNGIESEINVKIQSTQNDVELISEGITAKTTEEVTFDGNFLKLRRNEKEYNVLVLPSQAYRFVDSQKEQLQGMNLTLENEMGYTFRTMQQKRFLGLFQVEVQKEYRINAQSGKTVRKQSPFWEFLTVE